MKKFCVAAILTACAVPASAQDAREEGLGIRAGGFIVDPALTIGEEFDSNVFLTDTDETDTFLTTVAPQVAITSDWNRHGVRLDLGGEAGFFTHDGDDNYFDANARLGGVLDITRDARVTARAGYVRGHEARGSDDVPLFAEEPVRTNDFESELVVTVERGRFRFEPFGTYVFRDFEDTP
ncbi:MAG: outer membrane beta-barrel protein, partial [Thermohalobaculum sp.]|nr:outer membrane beta-barrel protein [Thermohalobaculum sp.]